MIGSLGAPTTLPWLSHLTPCPCLANKTWKPAMPLDFRAYIDEFEIQDDSMYFLYQHDSGSSSSVERSALLRPPFFLVCPLKTTQSALTPTLFSSAKVCVDVWSSAWGAVNFGCVRHLQYNAMVCGAFRLTKSLIITLLPNEACSIKK